MFMKTKYFKRFALTDRLVSIEELRHIAQMQARMDGGKVQPNTTSIRRLQFFNG